MSQPVYSQKFISATVGESGPVLEFPFAAGPNIFVVRNICHLMPADPIGSSFSVYDSEGCTIMGVTYGPDTMQVENWDLRQVYYGGDSLFWSVTLSPLNPDVATLRVSGYILTP